MPATPEPFTIAVPDAKLDWIRDRIRDHPWHAAPEGGGWVFGPDDAWLRDLCAHWLDGYDWRAVEAALNERPHFIAEADGLDLHFIHRRSPRADAIPLVLVHGWPGSFLEFLELIDPLADPDAHGAPGAPAFHVVVPSLPGYAFSGKPAAPIGPRRMAGHVGALMAGLGYDRYVAQGGDWGSVVCAWLGFDHAEACRAIHINMFGSRPSVLGPDGKKPIPAPLEGDAEKAWRGHAERWMAMDGGYFHVQATKPETLSYAMLDSPVGVAAWIGEKFRTWIDGREASLDTVIGRDRLLTNLMLYIVTDSFPTAAWTYRGYIDEGSRFLPPGQRVEAPVGIAAFPRELVPFPPRRYVELGYNVVRWTDMERGGHFAAMEAPDLLLADVRAFVAGLGSV
ncbi:MAG: alpha/beta fold hydrolase [Bauldia litoralis]